MSIKTQRDLEKLTEEIERREVEREELRRKEELCSREEEGRKRKEEEEKRGNDLKDLFEKEKEEGKIVMR